MHSMRKLMAAFTAVLLFSLAGTALAANTPQRVMPLDDPGDAPQSVTTMAPVARGALAATINVPADYATIQGAINAAASGDIIIVAAGTYAEAININAKNLTITGAGIGSSIITGTGAVTQYIVRITGGAIVDFSGFTVDGTGTGNDSMRPNHRTSRRATTSGSGGAAARHAHGAGARPRSRIRRQTGPS